MPSHNVTVSDINIAYKQIGKPDAKPIVLIIGASATMDMWNPLLLEQLASANYRVIIFENREVGETNALGISKADVLGWSMGGMIAEQLAVTNPDRVDNIILYTTSCGGSSDRPTPPEVIQIGTNASMSQQERIQKLAPLFFAPASWFEAHPDYVNYFPIHAYIQSKEALSQEIHRQQLKAAATWAGICNALSSITQPTLVIVGTDDDPAPDSLTLAEGIPGSWLIRIRDAGHGLMYQHPDEFNRVLLTFLETNH